MKWDAAGLADGLARLRRMLASVHPSHYRRFIVSFLAGLVVLAAMRVPMIDRSLVGQPDREMMQTAFRMRTDLISGGDPALLIDIDDATVAAVAASAAAKEQAAAKPAATTAAPATATTPAPAGPAPGQMPPGPRAPPATAPRGVIADALNYLRAAPVGKGAKAVIVDVDISTPTPGDEAGEAKLHQALDDWAHSASAPPLVIARQAYPDTVFGGQDEADVLPVTQYDDVVVPAPNIYWSQVKMMGDQEGIVREFLPYECVRNPSGPPILYSAALLAYGFLQDGVIPPGSNAKAWLDKAKTACSKPQGEPEQHGELINFHLSLERGDDDHVWPDLPVTWKGFATCGAGSDRAVFRRLSAADVAAAGPDASHEVTCGRLVIIGGTNTVAGDFEQTPLHDMAGPMILANAVRGLQLSNGGLKRVPLWLQLLTVLIVSTAITYGFIITHRLREHWQKLKLQNRGRPILARLRLLPFNPVVLNFVFAFAAHWIGIGLLLVALGHGYWGYLSAAAFASAAVGALQEFSEEEEKAESAHSGEQHADGKDAGGQDAGERDVAKQD